MRYKIYLDAGHGKLTPDKHTPDGVSEWELNNDVCNYIMNNLSKYNCDIFRCDDMSGIMDPRVGARITSAEVGNADILVSIHHNISGDGSWEAGKNASGVEVFISSKGYTEDSKNLASMILKNLQINTGLKSRGLKTAPLTICKPESFPTVLCEGGFMNNKSDNKYICSDKGKKAYAKSVSSAIISILNLSKDDEDSGLDNSESGSSIYIIRKSIHNIDSQIGDSYDNLASAIEECDKHYGYYVFGEFGEEIHKSTAIEEERITCGYVRVSNEKGLKMRAETSSKSAVIMEFPNNTKLELISKTTPTWWRCKSMMYEGYMYSKYLKEVNN